MAHRKVIKEHARTAFLEALQRGNFKLNFNTCWFGEFFGELMKFVAKRSFVETRISGDADIKFQIIVWPVAVISMQDAPFATPVTASQEYRFQLVGGKCSNHFCADFGANGLKVLLKLPASINRETSVHGSWE